MARIGIMQGRLATPKGPRPHFFPREQWRSEFPRAAQAGLDFIEWIYDAYGADVNPLGTDSGICEIRELSTQHGVRIASVCANYVMDQPIVRGNSEARPALSERLEWLMSRCHAAGIERIVLPFLDESRMEDEDDRHSVLTFLQGLLPVAEANALELHLETSLAPPEFASFLAQLPGPQVKVTYDSGNSSSLGYSPEQEFAAYGRRIGSVHIKDRVRGGSTVPLGSGNADFPVIFKALSAVGYAGDFVLEVARGEAGQEAAWARQNREFVVDHLAMSTRSAGEKR